MDNANLCASCVTVLKDFISSSEERVRSEASQRAVRAATEKAQYFNDLWISDIKRLTESPSMTMRQYFWNKEDVVSFVNAKPKCVGSLLTTTTINRVGTLLEGCSVTIAMNTSVARETLQKWVSDSLST